MLLRGCYENPIIILSSRECGCNHLVWRQPQLQLVAHVVTVRDCHVRTRDEPRRQRVSCCTETHGRPTLFAQRVNEGLLIGVSRGRSQNSNRESYRCNGSNYPRFTKSISIPYSFCDHYGSECEITAPGQGARFVRRIHLEAKAKVQFRTIIA